MNDVTSWLESLGLAEHAAAFSAQAIDAELLPELTDADLKELGITLLGHRKRLLRAIGALQPGAVTESRDAPAPSAPPAAPATSAPPAAPAREAERRQLTVMFCDVVGSTQLAGRLDPEDFQGLLRRYHAAAGTAVAPYAGHVAQLLGDGCLVYFGYPRAHEDDAERAVRAALAVLRAVAALEPQDGVALQTRIGIATGLVVVGEVGAGTPAAEQTASGETPNLAARLQAQAAPGEIVLSDETRHLLGGSFDLQSTGPLQLKGFATPIEAWRVQGERTVASRFEAQHESGLIDFIGRGSEVSLLLERWALAREGEGQVVLLTGEAGIGKSRITQTLRERLGSEPHATVLLQCSAHHRSSALHPLIRYFERTAGITAADTPGQRAEKMGRLMGPDMALSAAARGQLLRMMGASDGAAVLAAHDGPLQEQAQLLQEQAQLLQAPIELLRALTRQVPVLVLIEDAHWIDPTSQELGALTVELARDTRLLLLITARPEYVPSWGTPSHLTRLTLNRLGHRQCAELVRAVAGGRALPEEVLDEIIAKTDGIPLFVEELTKTVLLSGLLEAGDEGYRLRGPLPPLAIPSTLQDSLMARLDRLAPAKEVAQVGAMIGREFSRPLLQAVLQMPPARLDEALDALVHAGIVARRGVAPDEQYAFHHALIRDTAYNSLLKGQRALRHAQIAAAIEQVEPDTIATHPELLAHHHQEADQNDEAFRLWRAAAVLASGRFAHREAVMHYRCALALLPTLQPASARDGLELELQMKLGTLLMQTEGFSSAATVACHNRASELAVRQGRNDEYVAACSGLGASLWSAGRFEEVLSLMRPMALESAGPLKPMSRTLVEVMKALACFSLGQLAEARAATKEALRELEAMPVHERQDITGVDPRVLTLTQSVSISVHQGLLDQADAETRRALAIAEARDHAPSRSWALSLVRWMAYRQGDMETSIRLSEELLELAERMGFRTRLGSGRILMGRAVIGAGRIDEGTRLLQEGYAMWSALGASAGASEMTAIAADALIEAGRMGDAEPFVAAGEKALVDTAERYYAAELARLRGRLCEAAGDFAGAEVALRRALAIAAAQGAQLFSLRAATSLARMLGRQGRTEAAQALLKPALAQQREGLDQVDAVRARSVLAQLESATQPRSSAVA